MEVNFITSLQNLEIADHLGAGDKLDSATKITNDRGMVANLISPPGFKALVGALEFNTLAKGKAVIYSKEHLPGGVTPEDFLIRKLYQVERFQLCLWLYRDNSVNDEVGFLYYDDHHGFGCSSNFLASRFSTSQGKFSNLKINREELRLVRELYRSTQTYPETLSLVGRTQLIKGSQRLNRGLFHTQIARSLSDLALKVMCYCSALEAFFATSQAELSHQLSEGVAVFLHDDFDSRFETFKRLKKAYAIRSKITHGDVIDPRKLDELGEYSQFCDATVRAVVTRIFSDPNISRQFEETPENFDRYFIKLLLGSHT